MSGVHLLRSICAVLLLCFAGAAQAAAPALAKPPQGARDSAGVENLVSAAIAGDQARLQQAAADLRLAPRPARGDRRFARSMNERGLALWRRQRFPEAAVYFRQAYEADQSDAEIAENLGYALLKSGKVIEAESAILEALALAPERASAWGSLGLLRAKAGKHREGVACVLTAYRFAPDQQRTLEVYSRLAATDEDPKVRAMLADVISRLSGQPESKRG
jgi:Flp pilus assembly protein TadD